MSDLFERHFSDELPGKRPRSTGPQPEVAPEAWDAKPKSLKVNGQMVEFFTVGQLATALGLKPGTVRSWEQKGWLPFPPFRTRAPEWGGLPNKKQMGRRLWTRRQVAGIVRIAHEEGMLLHRPHWRHPSKSRFTQRVVALYEETMREIQET
jgi:hypothetical protein